MKNKEVKVECYTYTEMLEIYKNKYKQNYILIGYSHNRLNGVGILVLCPRKKAEQ